MNMTVTTHRRLTIILIFAVSQVANSEDWPQWNGPRRDGTVNDANILTRIPDGGLDVLWRKPCSLGYAGPVIANGKVVLFDYVKESGKIINNAGKRDELQGKERLTCLSADGGDLLWTYEYDRPYAVSYGGGPRATPCVHDGALYALGSEGDLTCLDVANGQKIWHRSFKRHFGAKTPMWGHAASPMIHGDMLICMVGGSESLVVAFDSKSGEERWRSLSSEETGYCPPTMIHHAGVDQLIVWSPQEISSLNPITGELYWQQPLKPDYGMSILPPIKDGGMLYAGGEGSKSVMLRLADDKPAVEFLWSGTPKLGVYLATSNGMFHEGHLYGADIRSGALICANGADGRRLWQTALPTTGSTRGRGGAHASAFLMRTDASNYLILSETGAIISAELTPERYKETGRFQAIEPMLKTMGRTVLWAFPAVANGSLYLRNDKELVCYSLLQ